MYRCLSLPLSLCLGANCAMADCAVDAMVVFDGSASMSEVGFDITVATRMQEARRAMADVMPRVQAVRRIGLVTYGPGGTENCTGISLEFAPRSSAAEPMIAALDKISPGGLTPLTAAVERAAEALDYRTRPAVVVLVTDGNETCGGTPCATSRQMAAEAANLTVHVLGFRMAHEYFSWNNPEQTYGEDTVAKCFADQTGGQFATTETVEELVTALNRVLGCPVYGMLNGGTQRSGFPDYVPVTNITYG